MTTTPFTGSLGTSCFRWGTLRGRGEEGSLLGEGRSGEGAQFTVHRRVAQC